MKLRCTNLNQSFSGANDRVEVLRDLNLETREREFLTIVGPSGCGKTTILRLLAGLAKPTDGLVERLPAAGDQSDRVLMVFQEDNLFPWLNLIDNACFGLEMQGVSREDRERRCRIWMERVGLAGREKAYPHELSTGMKQRVALIRAFLSDPAVLLLDEPFAALDYQTRLRMQHDLLELWDESNRSIVFVTHDVDEGIFLSDRILVLSNRPSTVIEEFEVRTPRPRNAGSAPPTETIDLKRKILTALQLPVGKALRAAG
ncbi:MAG: ABC transporter ATP-binding protein [Acidobacteria bacterium]|nr:ABC transporter ATP-binding protein [Acidobacteriota bacterium]MDA1234767.1 ABC transporter ATP-binding protein [Acidobacteriota bacterium]